VISLVLIGRKTPMGGVGVKGGGGWGGGGRGGKKALASDLAISVGVEEFGREGRWLGRLGFLKRLAFQRSSSFAVARKLSQCAVLALYTACVKALRAVLIVVMEGRGDCWVRERYCFRRSVRSGVHQGLDHLEVLRMGTDFEIVDRIVSRVDSIQSIDWCCGDGIVMDLRSAATLLMSNFLQLGEGRGAEVVGELKKKATGRWSLPNAGSISEEEKIGRRESDANPRSRTDGCPWPYLVGIPEGETREKPASSAASSKGLAMRVSLLLRSLAGSQMGECRLKSPAMRVGAWLAENRCV
jgi:hypothetical protein